MTPGGRVRQIRKQKSMTLEQFGEKVGVTKQTISRIENGINSLTEQMILSICREFGVNENWLRNDEGKMFVEVPAAMQAIIEYWKLDDVSKEALKNYIYKIAENSRE